MPPDQHFSRLLDDKGERVGHDEWTESFRHGGHRIKDRGKKHQHRGNDADGLPDVAQKYAQGCEHPGKAKGENDKRQQYQRDKNRCPVQIAVKQGKSGQQHAQADEAVEQRCTHGNDWQYFNRKYHFLDVIDVGKNQSTGHG